MISPESRCVSQVTAHSECMCAWGEKGETEETVLRQGGGYIAVYDILSLESILPLNICDWSISLKY